MTRIDFKYQEWNAKTNVPEIKNGIGITGQMFEVTVHGNTNIDGISDWKKGNLIWFDGKHWNQFNRSVIREYVKINSSLEINVLHSRKEDMSPNGKLQVMVHDDGDIGIDIIDNDGEVASLEFCNGGHSPATLAALRILAIAIIEDNQKRPTPKI